ncbi:TonB-dependent siderophore receptor [Lichenicola cladoniae]|uniref:TonB-dependent siderophore receptor n=1 Tax=Lichenicola cladoniae TaxID=1484109 RepID=A0A6M8HMZ9_9PROT|nr:TonB-dependent siderophore receptor [Lichenicola cladoniae]NPD67148.1 TonB-dependent siderophore receptor [Acetobacteraceae bacterium]QKE89677.1 TonB-dependent siderophore receptor [Lichenicola cladoniae]
MTSRTPAPDHTGWLRSTLGVAIASAWMMPAAARAQTTGDDATADRIPGHPETLTVIGHHQGYQELDPHLDRITTRLVDTPQTITEIPKQLLQDQNITSVLDALKSVPGISIAAGEGGQQGDNLSIRGFNAQNDFYRDGMLDFGSYYRDPFDLETIEVLKGPSATLFGRGSTGGVINQVTKSARIAPVAAGTLSFGTDGTERATIDMGRSSDALGGSAIRLNAMVNKAGLSGIDSARTRRYGIAPSLAFGLNTDTRVRFDYFRQQSYDTQYYGIPWINGRPANVKPSNFYGYSDDYLRSIVDIGTIRVEHDFGRNITVHDQIRYSSYNVGQRAVEPELLGYSGSTDIVPAGIPLSSLQVSRNVLALSGPSTLLDNQLEAEATFSTWMLRHAIVAGFEVQRQTADITRYLYPQGKTSLLAPDLSTPFAYTAKLRAMSGSVSNDLSPYINDTITLDKHWQVLGGWRWDHYTTEYKQIVAPAAYVTRVDDKPSWRGALVYKPTEHSSIYFNYGTSFDPSGENINLTAATARVAPETSSTYEVGSKWDLGRLSLTGALYQIRMSNVRETDPNDATRTILAGNYRSRGFELSATGHITPMWEVFGGYSYNDVVVVSSPNRNELGNSPPNAPKHTVALWTEYHIPAARLTIGGGVNYTSSRTASSLPVTGTTIIERAPGYTTEQLMVKYQVDRHVSLQLNLTNIGDQTYYSALHPTHIVVGPSRAALFSISASL